MENAEGIIKRFNRIHPAPMALNRLSQLLVSEEATLKDAEEVIKVDPLLVARILTVVNSAYYSPLQPIGALSRAVAYLGMRSLHNLVITDTLQRLASLGGKRPNELRLRIWRHSAAVSIAAKMIAERVFGIDGDNAYLAGILHDFGQIVEEQLAHEAFAVIARDATTAMEMVDLEQHRFGVDHCQIGAELCEQWMVSPSVIQAIAGHHSMEAVAPDSLGGILRLAEYLTWRDQGQGGVDPNMWLHDSLSAHITENSDEYAVLMEDFPAEMEKANELYGGRAT